MKVHYYPETDSLYIELKGTASARSYEVCDGLVVDLDNGGAAVGGWKIEHLSFFTMNSGAEVGLEIHRHGSTDASSIAAFGVDLEILRSFVESLGIRETVDDLARQLA